MEDKSKKTVLPWGMTEEGLQPNSVKSISQSKLKAFSLGRMNPLKKPSPVMKKKAEREEKKKIEAKEAAQVFEEFVASFEETSKAGKTFLRGSSSDSSKSSGSGVYKPTSKLMQKIEDEKAKEDSKAILPAPSLVHKKPQKKKGTEKKKSILELFREELKRSQEERKERHAKRESGLLSLDSEQEAPDESRQFFEVDEYKEAKGSFDTGDPLTTNLYVGNINPKMNEENLCQMFGKFGPLASVKVMWPRTEEERARNRNCGFVAFMKREEAEKALDHFKGTTIMEYEVQVGWGKAVPLPPHPIYVAPDIQEEENSKVPDPPSGLPFNAQHKKKTKSAEGNYGNVPPPGEGDVNSDDKEQQKDEENFESMLYNSIVKVVIPTDTKLLRLIHRMIEFVIREGPMFEAMIMNKEMSNPLYQFLFDNQSPSHIYYRWKLFSILQGDSPETWRTEEFRMFEEGSIWKPPPLKNLRSKVLPPVEEEIVRRGQLSSRNRDELEDQLRSISMEREKIKKAMIWCLDHAESAEEIVDCITESLCILETPLPMKIARIYLVTDILLNCSSSVSYSSNFRRGFESKLLAIIEHFHTVLKSITSRMRAEQFKKRVLACLRAWDQMSVYHFNVIDKLRETFIGRTNEELEKQKAFETVAALIAPDVGIENENVDGIPLLDDRPIDFSGGTDIDGVPIGNLDGEPLPDSSLDGVPFTKEEDIDGVPMESEPSSVQGDIVKNVSSEGVRSKWELVDYGDDSDESESASGRQPDVPSNLGESNLLGSTERQQLLAEIDERKRKILREVEVKVVELSDALEASGYSKAEISDRVEKFRDKLMQEAVEPKLSPLPSKARSKSRSPSPQTLAKYDLEDEPKKSKISNDGFSDQAEKHQSPSSKKRKRSHSRSPVRRQSGSHERVRKRSHSRSPRRRSKSRSRSPRRRQSPSRRRSRSKSPERSKHSSRHRSRSRSPKSHRHKSRSRSPTRSLKKTKRRSRSRSPHKSKSSRKSSRH